MDGPWICHTEWSKSEREKQIQYIYAFMCNLEKWHKVDLICRAGIATHTGVCIHRAYLLYYTPETNTAL